MRCCLGIFALLLLAAPAFAQSIDADTTRVLRIGTKTAPPFAFKQADSSWTGLSVELWEDIARDLDLRYAWHEMELEALLDGVRTDSLDAAVAALTITAEREAMLDFSHPFYVSGLGIAVRAQQEAGWWAAIKRLLSLTFMKVVAALFGLLLLVGVIVWLFERNRNPDQFGGSPAEGIASGFWWSAVTMTTVGYGDKAPVSLGGRLVALIWMFAALIMASSFTAAITSVLTVSQLASTVQGPDDLPGVQVGAVEAATSTVYLNREHVNYRTYATVEQGIQALRDGDIEALVHDAPILRYLIRNGQQGVLRVLPGTFETQYYGIALPKDSPLREDVNRLLLQKIEQPAWKDRLYRYLGE